MKNLIDAISELSVLSLKYNPRVDGTADEQAKKEQGT